VADIDAVLVQQILDISKREWKPDVGPHRKVGDLGRGLEVTKGLRFFMP
jgi:hypothetical protein